MKKLTLGKILTLGAALLGLIAFFLMFAPQLKAEALGHVEKASFSDVLFGTDLTKGAVGGFIGYLLILFGAVLAALTACVAKLQGKKLFVFVAAALLLIGAILVFCIEPMYLSANDAKLKADNGLSLTAGPVFAGIFGILGAGALVVSALKK